ncbi:hypothetical protein QFZ39_001160 [Paraburkholderia graminis]|nr:hypothetical protein [Paraburkholderia graminis]
MEAIDVGSARRVPWNKGKLTGQKPPLKLMEIWAIRIRLQLATRTRDLALFNLAIDSKLRACDLTRLRISDIRLSSRGAGDDHAAEDEAAGAVRGHRADTYECRGVDASRSAFGQRVSVSESHPPNLGQYAHGYHSVLLLGVQAGS